MDSSVHLIFWITTDCIECTSTKLFRCYEHLLEVCFSFISWEYDDGISARKRTHDEVVSNLQIEKCERSIDRCWQKKKRKKEKKSCFVASSSLRNNVFYLKVKVEEKQIFIFFSNNRFSRKKYLKIDIILTTKMLSSVEVIFYETLFLFLCVYDFFLYFCYYTTLRVL